MNSDMSERGTDRTIPWVIIVLTVSGLTIWWMTNVRSPDGVSTAELAFVPMCAAIILNASVEFSADRRVRHLIMALSAVALIVAFVLMISG